METWQATSAVERHPNVVSGAWVFRGTRVPVAALFENLRDGASLDDFLDWFPGVTRQQVEVVTSWPRIQSRIAEIQAVVNGIQSGDYVEQSI